jgi:hypothetical protein
MIPKIQADVSMQTMDKALALPSVSTPKTGDKK